MEIPEPILDASMRRYMQKRRELMEMEAMLHFSNDIKESFSDSEIEVNEIFEKLRKNFKNDDYNTIIHDYFT